MELWVCSKDWIVAIDHFLHYLSVYILGESQTNPLWTHIFINFDTIIIVILQGVVEKYAWFALSTLN
jgi:hypothetical protein